MNGDIELEVGGGSGVGNYAVRVLRAAVGGEPVGVLELDVEELLGRRDVLETTVLASAVPRRSVSVNEQQVREVGRQLFQALFSGPVYGIYRASLGAAQQRGQRLRVVLRLTAPELATLPWEMLFDPETETYLCRQEPLVRHVPAPYTEDPLEVRLPLRILALVASPRGLQALDVDAEKDHLAEALARPTAEGLIEVTWAPEATWPGVQARLLAGQWHVLHFVGHGDYDTQRDEGVLALVGRDGRADMVEASRLADLLGEAQPRPRLVVLNSCSSGQAGANDLFSGTAAALVRSGISAVAAMQFAVSDTAAIAFARGFYTAIANGRSVDEAARSGRISILGTPGSLEWVTPVLYVHGQATQLFTLTTSRAVGREAPPGYQPSAETQPPVAAQDIESARRRRAELSALYVTARAELRLEHFDTAIGLFDDLLTLDPGYPDAAGLRDTARRGAQLAKTYLLAAAAEDAGDLIAATRGYDEVLEIDPAYRDAAARKRACQARQQVADLQAELRQHASAGQWQAVIDVDTELGRLDPSASDPDGLATRARDALAAEQRAADLERPYTRARAAQDGGDWATAEPVPRPVLARASDVEGVPRRIGILTGHATAVTCVAFSPDGRLLASSGKDKMVRLWDPASGRRLRTLTRHTSPVNGVAFSPDGRLLASASSDATVRLWDPASGEHLRALTGHMHTVFGVAFSPDGRLLASASSDATVWLWDPASGERLRILAGHTSLVHGVAFSPDGRLLASAGGDKTVWLWDPASGEHLYKLPGHASVREKNVYCVAFDPGGRRLASAGNDKTVQLWDLAR